MLQAVVDDRIDIIATDHAPHTLEEKGRPYTSCPSGGPLVQHAVPAMFELVAQGHITKEKVVEKMCHAPAKMFQISKRGYLREGYYADLAILKPHSPWMVQKDNLLYRCGWSPMEGTTFSTQVDRTFVNGELVYENGLVYDKRVGERMVFNRLGRLSSARFCGYPHVLRKQSRSVPHWKGTNSRKLSVVPYWWSRGPIRNGLNSNATPFP